MTSDQALEAAAVMVAFANGRKIEYRKKSDDDWLLVEDPCWAWDCGEFRVAPEPWQCRIWVHDEDTSVFVDQGDGWKPLDQGWRLITVKEVLS